MSPFYCRMEEAEWVTEMRRFFAKNGYYRATDLNRLLGDPRVGVSLKDGFQVKDNHKVRTFEPEFNMDFS